MIRSIDEIFEGIGSTYEIGGNTPFLLNDPESVWYIKSGIVEVFSVRVGQEGPSGTRYHFFTAKSDDMLFGMDLEKYGEGLGLLAVGIVGTKIVKIPMEMFRQMTSAAELEYALSPLIDGWVFGLSYAVTKHVYPKPRVDEMLEPLAEIVMQDGKKARAKKGVVWLAYQEGSSLFIGMEEILPMDHEALFPIASDVWIQSIGSTKFKAHSTKEILDQQSMWAGLEYFYETLFKCEFFNTTLVAVDEYNRLTEKAERHKVVIGESLGDLASILSPISESAVSADLDNPLFSACLAIGKVQGIDFQPPPKTRREQEPSKELLNEIIKASRVRSRKVLLRGTWWKQDQGPLLGFVQKEDRPVALLPATSNNYALYDPVHKTRIPVTEEISAALSGNAITFYRPFAEQMITGLEMLRFGLAGTGKDLWRVIFLATSISLLALLVPIFTGYIFDTVIPQVEKNLLLEISMLMFVLSITTLIFQISQTVGVLRTEGKFDPATNAAIMDRLLSLPVPFFRNYSAGDLALRAGGIAEIRKLLSGAALMGIITGCFSLLSFPLLFYYDSKLAMIALAIAAVAFGIVGAAGYFQLKYQRDLRNVEGKISGLIFQIITGISKLRVAGAEGYAFAYWAKKFAEQRRLAYRARLITNRLSVFNSVLPIGAALAIFSMVLFASSKGEVLSTGDFLAFNSAFTQFLTASISMSMSIVLLMSIIPIYERMKPILTSLPEVNCAKAAPGVLSGEIEVSHLSFRYEADGPLILKEVSFQIEPGEFVAFVGPSGSGKSTLFRLLLGFESPERGAIQYDGQDVSVLDIDAVRRQIGVVLQQSRIMPGNIFQNIVGSSLLTLDDAWEAARMAGLDGDIKEMPMGMHTIIGEGASTFSGGQRQRLLIARAIANKPRILLFDEATSALDNRTQSIVSESLERLQATRIVIAHRLSTIMNADRIFVMQDGRIVQSGKYQELIKTPGLFSELSKRQLA
jgi:NHLM bacteriocin system ABC transporter ATP-binding protein